MYYVIDMHNKSTHNIQKINSLGTSLMSRSKVSTIDYVRTKNKKESR